MTTIRCVLKEQTDLKGKAPGWFQVFPAGTVLIEDAKPAVMDESGAALILAHFESLQHDMVIDYEHQTLSGDQAPAAGWIKALEWRGTEGLWAKADWTAKGQAYIENREYRYFSPVATIRKKDRRIVELYNVSLTNQPRMMNLRALVAKHNPGQSNERSKSMPILVDLKQLLKLADDADDNAVLKAVKTLVTDNKTLKEAHQNVACEAVLKALGVDDDADSETVVAKIDALKTGGGQADQMATDFAALKKDHLKLKQKLDRRDRDDRVSAALKVGKITAKQKGWADEYALKDPSGFDKWVKDAPVVVPLKDLEKDNPADGGVTPAERFEKLVAKKMKGDQNLTYGDAMNLVAAENPQLAEEYLDTGK